MARAEGSLHLWARASAADEGSGTLPWPLLRAPRPLFPEEGLPWGRGAQSPLSKPGWLRALRTCARVRPPLALRLFPRGGGAGGPSSSSPSPPHGRRCSRTRCWWIGLGGGCPQIQPPSRQHPCSPGLSGVCLQGEVVLGEPRVVSPGLDPQAFSPCLLSSGVRSKICLWAQGASCSTHWF